MNKIPPGAGHRIARVTETFFTEVGVLLFVFPVLDEYVQYGQKAITTKLIAGSLTASILSYIIAAGLAALTREGQD